MNRLFAKGLLYFQIGLLGLTSGNTFASSITERYLATIEQEATLAKNKLTELSALLDRAKKHHGFVTGDFWNTHSDLYTEETYRHLTNLYPLDRPWLSATERPNSNALGQHAANYRRAINGVELIPFNPRHVQNSRGLRQATRSFPAIDGGDSIYLTANTTQFQSTFRNMVPKKLQQAALQNLSHAEQQQFLEGLEKSVLPVIDSLFSIIYEQGIDALYRNRVIYSSLAKAEAAKIGLFSCLSTSEIFIPAEHRGRLAECDNNQYLPDMFSAYKIEHPRSETKDAKTLFFSEDIYIHFELHYQHFAVSGFADERERFSQLYDLQQTLTALVAQDKAKEEKHGSYHFFIDNQSISPYSGAIAVDLETGHGLWITPMYMAKSDIATKVAEANTAMAAALKTANEAIEVFIDDYIYQYKQSRPNKTMNTDGF